MATTPRLAIPYPTGTDPDNVPTWMHDMAVLLDGIISPTSHGTLAARPVSSLASPGITDRMYFATDVDPATIGDRAGIDGVLFRDNGNGWDPVGPSSSKVTMGAFSSPAVTGNQDYTGLGFQPKLVEFSFMDTTVTNAGRIQFGMGGMTAAYQYTMSLDGRLSSADEAWTFAEDRCLRQMSSGDVTNWSAAYVGMLADGFRINWIQTNGVGLRVVYKAWG